MTEWLHAAALLILLAAALGLFLIMSQRSAADLMMAVQLLGTAGAAIALLASVVLETPAMADVALMIAVLAAFSATALTLSGLNDAPEPGGEP